MPLPLYDFSVIFNLVFRILIPRFSGRFIAFYTFEFDHTNL